MYKFLLLVNGLFIQIQVDTDTGVIWAAMRLARRVVRLDLV